MTQENQMQQPTPEEIQAFANYLKQNKDTVMFFVSRFIDAEMFRVSNAPFPMVMEAFANAGATAPFLSKEVNLPELIGFSISMGLVEPFENMPIAAVKVNSIINIYNMAISQNEADSVTQKVAKSGFRIIFTDDVKDVEAIYYKNEKGEVRAADLSGEADLTKAMVMFLKELNLKFELPKATTAPKKPRAKKRTTKQPVEKTNAEATE